LNGWRDVRDPRTGKLLFRFDPGRDLIHLKRGRIDVKIPLRRYRSPGGRRPGSWSQATRPACSDPDEQTSGE
jgi:hypothetical protein